MKHTNPFFTLIYDPITPFLINMPDFAKYEFYKDKRLLETTMHSFRCTWVSFSVLLPDGSLKDASEIEWVNDPDDNTPIASGSQPSGTVLFSKVFFYSQPYPNFG